MSHPPSLLGSCCLVKAQLLRLHECVGHMPIIPLWACDLGYLLAKRFGICFECNGGCILIWLVARPVPAI